MIKKLITSAILAFAVAVPSAAFASPVTGSFADHQLLWRAVRQVGVRTVLNDPKICGDGKRDGAYVSQMRTLFVCQTNGTPGGPQVSWTDDDMDTLRHEAHHIIQDCAAGDGFGGGFRTLFTDPKTLFEFIDVSEIPVERIIKVYKEEKASPQIIILELEAFATAKGVSALTISTKMVEACGTLHR
jgi:hypothetical protein